MKAIDDNEKPLDDRREAEAASTRREMKQSSVSRQKQRELLTNRAGDVVLPGPRLLTRFNPAKFAFEVGGDDESQRRDGDGDEQAQNNSSYLRRTLICKQQEIQRWFELDAVQRNPANSGSIAWVVNCLTRKVSTASVLVFW